MTHHLPPSLPQRRFLLLAGALLGLTGVLLGALGAHALKPRLSPEQYESFLTATRYQMYHALALVALAWSGGGGLLSAVRLQAVGWLWTAGAVCFSSSIYLLLAGAKALFWVTPVGGGLLIVGWFLLFLTACVSTRNRSGVSS